MAKTQVELGDLVSHKIIKGYTGVVTAVTYYLNGCRRMTVQPTKLDKEGAPRKDGYFDEQELGLVKREAFKIGNQDPGGPRSVPPRIQAPG